jgi:aminoglycoside phosphotransferase (APT) family kinase protein
MSSVLEASSAQQGQHHDLVARLQRFIETECGIGRRVANFGPMEDGHAGLTFGFDVAEGDGGPIDCYALKLAPVGVTRRGNTDVYRQAPLLRALKGAGMPVPPVPWASANNDALGAPFIVMERLPGRVFVVWEPHQSFSRDAAQVSEIWLQAARMLAQLHRIDWQSALPDWEKPRSLQAELDFWTPLLRHAPDRQWREAGVELNRLLAASIPDPHPVGVVHGDFQPGNILYVEGRAETLIDWELASIGSQGLDLGWLMMMSDEKAWDPSWRPVAPVSKYNLIGAYCNAGGPALSSIDWHQALGHFKLGAIACLNIKLHRSGKRKDDLWERFATSVPCLFARGMEIVGHARKGRSAWRSP